MAENIIQKIIDNKDKIIGIRLDGTFYDVDYVSVDDVECFDMLADDDTIIRAYQMDNQDFINVQGYEFTVADIEKAKEVKLYKLQEV